MRAGELITSLSALLDGPQLSNDHQFPGCRSMADTADRMNQHQDRLDRLLQEASAERAGQGREHVLQSIQQNLNTVEAQINRLRSEGGALSTIAPQDGHPHTC